MYDILRDKVTMAKLIPIELHGLEIELAATFPEVGAAEMISAKCIPSLRHALTRRPRPKKNPVRQEAGRGYVVLRGLRT